MNATAPVSKSARTSLPLSLRLTLIATAVLAVSLLVAGWAFRMALHAEQLDDMDQSARERLASLVRLIEDDDVPHGLPTPRDSPLFAQVVGPDGTIVGSTPNVSDMRAIAPASAWAGAIGEVREDSIEIDKADCRLFATSVITAKGAFGVLVAAPFAPVRRADATLMRQMLLFGPLVVLGSGALLWFLTRRALRPVDRLRTEVDAIGPDRLEARLSGSDRTDEVGRLAATMNGLLDRLQRASNRERRFVSDASHELRSPLASMRTQLEVGLRRADATEWPNLAEGVLQENRRLERLVTDLLTLARTDQVVDPVRREVDLDDIVLSEVASARIGSPLPISSKAVSAGRVLGDADQLRRVVINLLDNAKRYARTQIDVSLQTSADAVILTVADDGPGVPESERLRVFERFTRVDEARARSGGGSGLGLAIVREIAETHGGSVAIAANEPSGARVVLSLPLPNGAVQPRTARSEPRV